MLFAAFRPNGDGPLQYARRLILGLAHATYAGLLLLVLLIVSEEVFPSSLQLSVSAVVLKKAWIRVTPPPAILEVTDDDIARGYIDAPQVTAVRLRNNSDDGFVFHFQINPEVVSSVNVNGLQQPVVAGPAGATVILQGHFRTEQQLDLRWRFRLAPQTSAGPKAWPVQMGISVN